MTLQVTRCDDRVLVYCFAGCATVDVLAAVGMTLGDLFDPGDRRHAARPAARPGPRPRPEPNPLGDPDYFCDRIIQQEALERSDAYQRRRARAAAWAQPRPGDYTPDAATRGGGW
jgi:hypothetical protein